MCTQRNIVNFEVKLINNTIISNDILLIIDNYLTNLKDLDKYKNKIKNLAESCSIKCAIYKLENYNDYLGYAIMNYDDSYYEHEYGPSGDYGNYIAMDYKTSIIELNAHIICWNKLVDTYENIKDKLPLHIKLYLKKVSIDRYIRGESQEFIANVLKENKSN